MPADAVANGVDDEPEPRADGEPESRPDANADVVADISTDHRGADSGDGAAHIDDAAHGRAGSRTQPFANVRSNDAAHGRSESATEPGSDVKPNDSITHLQSDGRAQSRRALDHTERHRVRRLGRR